VIAFVLLGGCVGAGKDAIFGTVSAAGSSAMVSDGSAYGVNVAGRAIVLQSPNPDLTCDDAIAYARVGSTDDNPGDFVPAGTCGVYIEVPTGYDPAGVTVDDDATRALVSLSCAMGDGEWVREERGEGDLDWYWSGAYWQGTPDGFGLALAGGDEVGFSLTLEMASYAGSFVYDTDNPDPDPATGDVSMAVSAEWCPGLASAVAR